MDDFSNPKSGWPSWISGNGSLIAYQAGGLRMLVNQAQSDLLAWPAQPGVNFNNARIEVDTVKLAVRITTILAFYAVSRIPKIITLSWSPAMGITAL